jgi:hypothetical protein
MIVFATLLHSIELLCNLIDNTNLAYRDLIDRYRR